MADRYPLNIGGTYSASTDDIWHSLSNQGVGDGGGFTEAADRAILDAAAGGLTVTKVGGMTCQGVLAATHANTLEVATSIDVNGDTLQLGAGATVLGAGDIRSAVDTTVTAGCTMAAWTGALIMDGTSTLATGAAYVPTIEINTSGTITLAGTITSGTLAVTAGTLDNNGQAVDTADWTIAAGATVTGAGNVAIELDMTVAAGADLSGFTGTCTFDGGSILTTNGVALGPLAMDTVGGVTLGSALTCGDIAIAAGDWVCGGWTIKPGSLTATGGAIDLGSAYIQPAHGKTLNFTNLAVTNTAAHIVAAGGTTVTVSNMPNTGVAVIHCHGCADGGGNDAASVDFDKHAVPGSLSAMGAGC